MGILDKVRCHAWVASGKFDSMFKDVELPPLPEAAARLVREVSAPEPDLQRVERVISATPELSARVIRVINSPLYSLPNHVSSVFHAVNLLGFPRIREIALAFAALSAVPRPRQGLFDHEAFWADSLARALLARAYAGRCLPGAKEEAFTTMLLADVAVPVLLCGWSDYYRPIVDAWSGSPERLSRLERESLGWDHAQAGAWILQSWGFPEEMVALVGTHNLGGRSLGEMGLIDTLARPLSLASLAPSVLKPEAARAGRLITGVQAVLGMGWEEQADLIDVVRGELEAMLELFDLDAGRAFVGLDRVAELLGVSRQEPAR